jgi:hypothetical protein
MPQNFPTQTLELTEDQWNAVRALPVLPFPEPPSPDPVTGRVVRPRRPFLIAREEGYRVLDAVLTDGRVLRGLLAIGDELLVPIQDGPITSEQIAGLAPTPPEAIPDFSITEPDTLWEPRGSTTVI